MTQTPYPATTSLTSLQSAVSVSPTNPSYLSSAVLAMMPFWDPIDVCMGGTMTLRTNANRIIPQEPKEDDASYKRRIFHATMPPFLTRLASQAAGIILRNGIEIDGDPYWDEWIKDVSGDGTTLDEYARNQLITAILYGHSSTIVDYGNVMNPRSLAEERGMGLVPYLVPVRPHQILGWHTTTSSATSRLAQVRIRERLLAPYGPFGEEKIDQIRVMTPGAYEIWRTPAAIGTSTPAPSWTLEQTGKTSLDCIPLVTVYSNRLGNLLSRPPLLEIAHLCVAYAQRFCDYHHSIHVGANPILTLRGYDDNSDTPLGISVNTALLLPPDGGAEWVQPTAEAFDAQLKCLKELEEQISRLGINTLAQANLTNAAAEARRLDRVDSDSIMAVISGDLERAITQLFEIASKYVGIDPPVVTISRDYDSHVIDGNTITAYLQLFMQNAISHETLLRLLQDGEILPPNLDLEQELALTKEHLAEQQATDRLNTYSSLGPDMAFQQPSDNAGQGQSLTSQTLPTPLRPGRNAN